MTESLRLAFVSPRYADGATVGGAETLLRNLAVRAARKGHEVRFLTTCARDHFSWRNDVPPGTRQLDGISVEFFPVDEDRDLELFLNVQERISNRRAVSRDDELQWMQHNVNSSALYDHLREQQGRYDMIVMGPYLFGLIYFAAQIAPAKTVLIPCLHDESFAYLQTVSEMFKSVRGFMFNTRPEGDLACRLYGLDPEKLSVVGMGLEPFEAEPGSFAENHRIESPYVLYCGRREPLKGTPLLLDYVDAFRMRTGRDIKLVLTGSGHVEIPPTLAGHVIDAGFVSEKQKRAAMAGAVAFCHPSSNESLGIVLLESWLEGTPGLVHAGSEVLAYQCRTSSGGLWFRSYPEFETELLLLLDDRAFQRKLGDNGREYVLREYSWPAVERRFEDALCRLGTQDAGS